MRPLACQSRLELGSKGILAWIEAMHRIKIFSGPDINKVEQEINDWLTKQGTTITVVQMTQSESEADPGQNLI